MNGYPQWNTIFECSKLVTQIIGHNSVIIGSLIVYQYICLLRDISWLVVNGLNIFEKYCTKIFPVYLEFMWHTHHINNVTSVRTAY